MSYQIPPHEIFIPEQRIKEIVKKLGKQITTDYAGKKLLIIGVLKGSFVFLADLIREINLPLSVEFIGLSSYQGVKSTGNIIQTHDLKYNISGRDVLIVEDIIDTGNTLEYLLNVFQKQNPASLKVCSMFTKPAAHQKPYHIDYIGTKLPNKFIVGYGLDLDGLYRNLSDVVVLT